jgi:hypothetical protein
MLFDGASQRRSPFVVLIDIGSGSVGVAVADVGGTEGKPLIIYTHREHIRRAHDRSSVEHIRVLKEALLNATLELSTGGMQALHAYNPHARIRTIHTIYAAPWSELISRKIHTLNAEPFRATPELVESLIESALHEVGAKAHEDAIFHDTGLEVIGQSQVGAKINGYDVPKFNGQECTELEVIHMSELVPKAVRDVIRDAEKHLIPHPEHTEHSFASVFALFVERVFPHMGSYLTCEMTGGGTEISVVQDHVVRENVSTNAGMFAFENEIATRLNTLPEEARTYIRDFTSHEIHHEVAEAVGETREGYKALLAKLCADVHTRFPLPEHLIVLADHDYRELFTGMVEEAYSALISAHTVHAVDLALTDSRVLYHESASHDMYLAMCALFFHTTEVDQMHRR